jgi:hypothetical protein
MNIYFIFPGYLTSVDSYMNLQVLLLVFGSLAVVILDLLYLFFIVLQAHHSFNMEEHAKKMITTFATGCSLLTQRSTLMDNSLETWVRF